MESLYLLIPLSLIIVTLVVWIFFWAVKSGQFEDLEGPAYRILDNEENEDNEDADDLRKQDAIMQDNKLDEQPDNAPK